MLATDGRSRPNSNGVASVAVRMLRYPSRSVCLSHAVGGVSRPEAVDGAVTLFARPNPEADDVGAGGRECMPGLVLSLCEHMALQVPEKFQPRSSRQVRGRTGPPVVSMDEGEEDEDEDGDEEEVRLKWCHLTA